MSKFHLDQIATYIESTYSSDHFRPDLDPVNNLSRYLALYSVDTTLGDGPGAAQRLVEVTDGTKDRGIDAIAVDPVRNLLVLSQAKWKQDGKGAIDVADVIRFTEGVRSLVGARNSGEPVHATHELRTAIGGLIVTPSAKIAIVTASTGNKSLSNEAMEPIDALLREMNDLEGVEPIMMHRHFSQADLFNSLTREPRRNVDLEVDLLHWGGGPTEPLKIFYGRVSGADIAQWYKSHQADLFAENIRVVIPRSEINAGMIETVKSNPERFGYYNNGIVILAANIKVAPQGMLNRDVLHVALERSSVVNGAQTVSTLGSLLGTDWEANLSRVFVLTRCIEVPAEDPTLARGITRYANTQNEVSNQDFAFLDEQQHRLAKELSLMDHEYVIRQAEQPSSEDPSKIVYVRDAAVALACSDGDLGLAVTAKREVSRLFSQSGPEYGRLFNAATDPLVLLRSVKVVRKVDYILDEMAQDLTGVEYGVAVHGRLAIAHLALLKFGKASLADPAWDFNSALDSVEGFTRRATAAMAAAFPDSSYPGNVFKNRSRTDELFRESGLAQ